MNPVMYVDACGDGFLPINAHDEFDVLQRQLQGEDFTMEYMERQLDLTEVFFEPPQAEVVRQLLLERGSLGNVRRAAAFYKLQRYSYNGSGDSYGVGSCDIRRFFRDLWECSHRLKMPYDAKGKLRNITSTILCNMAQAIMQYSDPETYEILELEGILYCLGEICHTCFSVEE